MDGLLRSCARLGQQWRRILLERLDAVASIYRLASAVSDVAARPVRLPLVPGRLPLDAAMTASGRQDRGRRPAGTHRRPVRLRQAPVAAAPGAAARTPCWSSRPTRCGSGTPAGLLARTPSLPRCWPLERDAVPAGARRPGMEPAQDRRQAIWTCATPWTGCDPGGGLPVEEPPSRADPPRRPRLRQGTASDMQCQMLPVMLRPAEKRALDLISDWPWMSPSGPGRADGRLGDPGLPARDSPGRVRPGDPPCRSRWDAWPSPTGGWAFPARRDRTSVGVARRRWSVNPSKTMRRPLDWRNVSGRQKPAAAEEHGAHRRRPRLPGRPGRPGPRLLGWETVQLDPPHRASRHFRHDGTVCAPSTPTPSESCARAMRHLALLPGVGAPGRAPSRPCPTGSPPTCATTTPPTGPPTTTASGPPSWWSSTTTSPATHFLRAGAGGDAGEAGVTVPLWVSHQARPSSPWGRWDAPGAPRRPGVAPGPAAPHEPIDQQRREIVRPSFPSR